jgi:acyl-CoA reductase-like NAD-dependent aldehyde dehydrogenase
MTNYLRGRLGAPFGGTKHSGYGWEDGVQTLRVLGYTKQIRFPPVEALSLRGAV